MEASFSDGRCGLMLAVLYHGRPAGRPWDRVAKQVWPVCRGARCSVHPLLHLGGVTAGAEHRDAYHVALLLKKASAWHGAWSRAPLPHDPLIARRVTPCSMATNRHERGRLIRKLFLCTSAGGRRVCQSIWRDTMAHW